NGESTNSLHTRGVLDHAKRVQDSSKPIFGQGFRDLLDLRRRDPRDALAHLKGVTRNKLLEVRKNAMRIIQARSDARHPFRIELITPSRDVILMLLLIETAEQSILEVEGRVAQEESISVGGDVVLVIQLVNEHVVDHNIEKSSVDAEANPRVDIRRC